jgi:multidrug efflux pump subunit AcrA (membrane-fusion protein)
MEFEGVMSMQSQSNAQISTQEPQSPPIAGAQRRPRRGWLTAVVIIAAFAGLLVSGILQRVHTSAALRTETADMAVPTISVVSPQRAAPSQEIVLPGNVQPYVTAPIFSRTNGYLQAWYFDIGAHVKKGQLLAVIATPEVDQQLGQSRSNLSTAEANLRLAEITKNRYQGLLKSNAVSQQDVDNAVGTYNANKSIVDAFNPSRRSTPPSTELLPLVTRMSALWSTLAAVAASRPICSISLRWTACAFMSMSRKNIRRPPLPA